METKGTVTIKKRFEFHAAHNLPNHKGKCKKVHGHSYLLDVEILAPVKDDTEAPDHGMVMDFTDLKRIVETSVIDFVDHNNLNDIWTHPTAEIMIKQIAQWIQNSFKREGKDDVLLYRLELWETSTSSAIWRAKC